MQASISTLSGLLEELDKAPAADVVFSVEGRPIQPDYHVTEFKFARLRSMDCGGRLDEWNELLVQLLDGPAKARPNAEYMKAATLSNIASKAASSSAASQEEAGELYFEYSAPGEALRKLSILGVDIRPDKVVLELGPVGAVCKPVIQQQALPAQRSCC